MDARCHPPWAPCGAGGPSALGPADYSGLGHIVERGLGCGEFVGGKASGLGENRPACRGDLQDDPVLCRWLREFGHEDVWVAGPYPLEDLPVRLLEVENLACVGCGL